MVRRRKRYGAWAGRIGLGLASALLCITSGVAFAILTSQNATLQGSSISSATANLQIGTGSGNYAASAPGFVFSNVEPGTQWAPADGNIVTLHNSGTTTLTLRATISPINPSYTSGANLSKVSFGFTPVGGGTRQELTMAALQSAYTSNSPIALNVTVPAGQDIQIKLQVQIASDAVTTTTSGIGISNIDLIFSGVSTTS